MASRGWRGAIGAGVRSAFRRVGLLREGPGSGRVFGELIGSAKRYRLEWYDQSRYAATPTKDAAKRDYAFWDRLRRGKAIGFELSGVFMKPLENKIASWALGNRPKLSSENPKTETAIAAWWGENHAKVLAAYRDSIGLGDCYIVLNGDGSLTVVPPNVVTHIVDPTDFSKVIGYRIVERYTNPLNANVMTVEDQYYADRRERITYTPGGTQETQTFENPLGLIPVVQVSNNTGADELYGRPEGEAALKVLEWYNEIMVAGLQGNIRQGRPTPVVEGMTPDQIDFLMDTQGVSRQYVDDEGEVQTHKVIYFDSDQFMAVSGTFKYAQPGAFAGETEKFAGLLFYLLLQHTEIPEFIWGNAISSSKASAESQLPAFAAFIEAKQTAMLKWVNELLTLAVTWHSIFDAGVLMDDVVSVGFAPLTGQDGKLTLDAIALGLRERLLDRETALQLMPLDVDNPSAVLDAAMREDDAEVQRLMGQQTAQAERDVGFTEPEGEPAGEPDEDAQESAILEMPADNPLFAFLPLDNNVDVMKIVRALRDELEPDNVIEWQASPTYHVTLAYARNADDTALRQIANDVRMPASIRLTGSRLAVFDTPKGYALHIVVDGSAELSSLQQSIYDTFHGNARDVSPFSTPSDYNAHITLCYLRENTGWREVDIDFLAVADRVVLARDNYEPVLTRRAFESQEGELRFENELERILAA